MFDVEKFEYTAYKVSTAEARKMVRDYFKENGYNNRMVSIKFDGYYDNKIVIKADNKDLIRFAQDFVKQVYKPISVEAGIKDEDDSEGFSFHIIY